MDRETFFLASQFLIEFFMQLTSADLLVKGNLSETVFVNND